MHSEFLGKNGFVWWMGVVEDVNDPKTLGRCKVRIFGWHNMNEIELPTSELQWSQILMPVTTASFAGIGQSPTGLKVGSWVMGMFLDGDTAQYPLIIGSLPGEHHSQEIYGTSQGTRDFFTNQKISFTPDASNPITIPSSPNSSLTSDSRKPIKTDGTPDNTQYNKQEFINTQKKLSQPSPPSSNRMSSGGGGIMGKHNWVAKNISPTEVDDKFGKLKMHYNTMLMFDKLVEVCRGKGISLKPTGTSYCGYVSYKGGRSSKSQHLKGRAIDFVFPGRQKTLQVIVEASKIGFKGIGIGKNIIHIDTGGRRAWGYGARGGKAIYIPRWAAPTIRNHLAGRY